MDPGPAGRVGYAVMPPRPGIRTVLAATSLVLAGCGPRPSTGATVPPSQPPPAAPAPAAAPAPPADPPAKPSTSDALHGPGSAAVEPFRVVGNIYYVGARNVASYLITTPNGHILLDTGTKEMESVVPASIEKLGFHRKDIKILLSGHAHWDHVGGHAAMRRATGAQVMALGDDAVAIEAGADRSPLVELGTEGWAPVHVDRVLKDGDTVTLGGTTMTAVWAPGHTPGCTIWTTRVTDHARPYAIAFYACAGPNLGVTLVHNPKFPTLAEDSLASFRKLKRLHPDIVLWMHPEAQFEGKVERIKAGETPHPLYDPAGWPKLLDDAIAGLQERIDDQRAARPR